MHYEIFYPSPLNTVSDIINEDIDAVTIAGGQEFSIAAVTPENLKFFMTKEKTRFNP